jgi:hypothetical protein
VQALTCTERRPAAGALPEVVAAAAAGVPNAALLLLPIALRLPVDAGTARAAAWRLQAGPAAETVCMLVGWQVQAGRLQGGVVWANSKIWSNELQAELTGPSILPDFALERPEIRRALRTCFSRLHHSCPPHSLASRPHCL